MLRIESQFDSSDRGGEYRVRSQQSWSKFGRTITGQRSRTGNLSAAWGEHFFYAALQTLGMPSLSQSGASICCFPTLSPFVKGFGFLNLRYKDGQYYLTFHISRIGVYR